MVGDVVMTTENKSTRKLISIVEEFRRLDQTMQAQMMLIFLKVVARPGITMRQIEQETDLASSSVSRNVAALSAKHKNGQPGHGLIEVYLDEGDNRYRKLRLTPQGKRLASTLAGLIGE